MHVSVMIRRKVHSVIPIQHQIYNHYQICSIFYKNNNWRLINILYKKYIYTKRKRKHIIQHCQYWSLNCISFSVHVSIYLFYKCALNVNTNKLGVYCPNGLLCISLIITLLLTLYLSTIYILNNPHFTNGKGILGSIIYSIPSILTECYLGSSHKRQIICMAICILIPLKILTYWAKDIVILVIGVFNNLLKKNNNRKISRSNCRPTPFRTLLVSYHSYPCWKFFGSSYEKISKVY